jgi:hypothetical protein
MGAILPSIHVTPPARAGAERREWHPVPSFVGGEWAVIDDAQAASARKS